MGLEDLEALQPAVAHSMARMLDPAGFSDADFVALDQRFELSYEAYGALKVDSGRGWEKEGVWCGGVNRSVFRPTIDCTASTCTN